MMSHIIVYVGLTLAYFDAALESFTERKSPVHCACLYGSIAALMVFDRLFLATQAVLS
jgi:hypothetical protein